tara:strand:- start:650 stop:2218 length:1569 start_codon:yes stop_codon:yes gene_type:complete
MSSIINPYRFAGEGPAPGGDYVTITSDETIRVDSGDGDYKYIEFDSTTSSAFEVTDAGGSGSDSIEVYCIAGGGGGGCANALSLVGTGAGGGAGGYVRETSFKNGSAGLAQTYDVTVGGGGGAGANTGTVPTVGIDSRLKDTVSRSMVFGGSNSISSWDGTTGNDFAFGSDDYTIECWFYATSTGGYKTIFYRGSVSINLFIYNGAMYFYTMTSVLLYTTIPAVTADEWHHVAVVRNGTTFSLYYDGKFYESGTASGSEPSFLSAPFYIGYGANGHFIGTINNFRVSNTARYTGTTTYTIPYAPFVSDSNTKLLIQPISSDTDYEDSSSNDWPLGPAAGLTQSTNLPPLMTGFGGGRGSYFWSGTGGGGGDGGSGGGGGTPAHSGVTPGTGVAGQGNDGGTGAYTNPYIFPGGGGAGGVGEDWGDGTGGDGADYSWMFDNSLGFDDGYFAGGGGGGGPDGASGGYGGGGAGGAGDDEDGYAGETNSGGAGGGAGKTYWSYATGANGGAGGSGKVIIRWKWRN